MLPPLSLVLADDREDALCRFSNASEAVLHLHDSLKAKCDPDRVSSDLLFVLGTDLRDLPSVPAPFLLPLLSDLVDARASSWLLADVPCNVPALLPEVVRIHARAHAREVLDLVQRACVLPTARKHHGAIDLARAVVGAMEHFGDDEALMRALRTACEGPHALAWGEVIVEGGRSLVAAARVDSRAEARLRGLYAVLLDRFEA